MSAKESVAVVTGAGSGIGRATALAFLEDGWRVALAGRRKEPLEETLEAAGAYRDRALAVPTDVGDPKSVQALFTKVKDTFGRVDVLFNNAGQNVPGIGKTALRAQAFCYGASGIGGNRVNIGVANPNDTAASINLRISDKNSNTLYTEAFTLQPHQYTQFNDIFTRFGITPQADVQVEYNTAANPIYGYVSQVRNDTGDGVFIVGTSPNS